MNADDPESDNSEKLEGPPSAPFFDTRPHANVTPIRWGYRVTIESGLGETNGWYVYGSHARVIRVARRKLRRYIRSQPGATERVYLR